MIDESGVSTAVEGGRSDVTVLFGERFQASDGFDVVFREGMELVERTAAYLDGDGRRAAKVLKPPVTVLYATESMRLTTRLLDLASWLLIKRALKDGEITDKEARRKRQRVKLQSLGRPSHIKGFDDLPEGIRDLIVESFALHDRIKRLDQAMMATLHDFTPQSDTAIDVNPVGDQMTKLRLAFGG